MIPSTADLEVAIVKILMRNEAGLTVQAMLDEVVSEFRLPPEAKRVRGANGRSELSYRLGWARTHAKNKGLIEKLGNGVWKACHLR